MYFATLDCATSNPSLSSSPWIRGAPQSGFSTLIRRISMRKSVSICGGPPRRCDFHAKPNTMPAHQRLRLNDRKSIQDKRIPSMRLDEEPAIAIRQPDLATQVAPQYDQLMAEHHILCFKPAPRLKWRGPERKQQAQQPDHRVSL